MRSILEFFGTILFWLLWPALRVYLALRPRTRVLVASQGQILVVKSWLGRGKWGLPGGGLHAHEDQMAGSLRELAEETGLQLKPAELQPLLSNIYRGAGLRFHCHYYLARLPRPVPLRRQWYEISRLEWRDPQLLSNRNANPDVLDALAAAVL